MLTRSRYYLFLLASAVGSISHALPKSPSSIFGGAEFEPWFQCVNFQVKGSMQGIIKRCSSCVLSPENASNQDCSACCGGSLGTNQYLLCEVGQSCCIRMLGKKAGGRIFVKQAYLDTYDNIETNTCANFFVPVSPPGSTCGQECALGLDTTGTKRLDCSKQGYLLPNSKTVFSPTSECASPAENIMARLNVSSGSQTQDGKGLTILPLTSDSSGTRSDSKSNCFPGDVSLELESGNLVRMDTLKIGNVVKVGPGVYSTVFMFTHKDPKAKASYIILSTVSKAMIKVTPGHYLYANKHLTLAGNIRVGDFLTLQDGSESMIETVQTTQSSSDGLFNPQTIHGDIVVNGIVASTYTAAVDPPLAHAALFPLRALHTMAKMRWDGLERDSILRTAMEEFSKAFGSSVQIKL